MIYLLVGDDKFRRGRRVQELREQFGTTDDLSFSIIDTFDLGVIENELMSVPFLSPKRLVLINALSSKTSKDNLEKLVGLLKKIPESTICVVAVDAPLDSRLSASKELQKIAKTEAFAPVNLLDVKNIVLEKVSAASGSVDPQAIALLQQYIGNDLNQINLEVDKLLAYDKQITVENVKALTNQGYFNSIFDLTDSIGRRNSKSALAHLDKMLAAEDNMEQYLISMISGHIRNLMLVADLKSHGLTQEEISKKAKLHPFVVKKALEQTRNFGMNELIGLNRSLLQIDIDAKSGGLAPAEQLRALFTAIPKK